MRARWVALLGAIAGACGGAAATTPPSASLAAHAPESHSATPPASPSSAPAASAAAPSSMAVRWKDYPGPSITPSIVETKAWAVVPVGSDDWDVLKIAQCEFVRTEGDMAVLGADPEVYVPGALTRRVSLAKTAKVGSPVLASVYLASAYARVVKIDADEYTVQLHWVRTTTETVTALDLIVLDGTAQFGAPVAYPEDGHWTLATLAYTGPDAAWVVGFAGKPAKVDPKAIRPLDVTRTYKKGDKVWASKLNTLLPATVVDVVDAALKYKVKFDDASEGEAEVTFDGVTKPL